MCNTLIRDKIDLIKELEKVYSEVSDFVKEVDQKRFDLNLNDKWSVACQLEHLILSSKGVASALKMSKLKLQLFGTAKHESRSYDELYSIYKDALNTGVKASLPFIPKVEKAFSKEELLENWQLIIDKFSERIEWWSEKDLDKYQLPHPAIGKLTVREMLLFTILHTRHHLKSMKLISNV